MNYSLKSSFARQILVLLVVVLALTVVGRIVAVSGTAALCTGWPVCWPDQPLGWMQFVHRALVALAAVLMMGIFRKAWREQRENTILLPLTTIVTVLFMGQAFIGALGATGGYPRHLAVLHGLTATSLWIALAVLTFVSGVIAKDPVIVPGLDAKQRFKDFFALTKPLIVGLLLATTLAGLVAGYGGWPPLRLVLWTLVGGAMAAGGSSALNQYIDRELDRHMQRTSWRPLAAERLTPAEGLSFGIALCLSSYYILAGYVNLLAALLSLAGIIYYVLFYSVWLKKATVQNIVIGGGAGAIPPMVGWAAATGSLNLAALVLFAIVFMWTPPHFWALAIVRKNDYERAGVPMMPVVRGEEETRRQIMIYTVILVAVTLLLPVLRFTGIIYLISALVLGAGLIYAAWRVWRVPGNKVAFRMYRWSSMYLLFIFIALMLDAVIKIG
jgi:protoheme IX farnesyltransferase